MVAMPTPLIASCLCLFPFFSSFLVIKLFQTLFAYPDFFNEETNYEHLLLFVVHDVQTSRAVLSIVENGKPYLCKNRSLSLSHPMCVHLCIRLIIVGKFFFKWCCYNYGFSI